MRAMNDAFVDTCFHFDIHVYIIFRFATVYVGLTNLKECKEGVVACLVKESVTRYVSRNKNQRSSADSSTLHELYLEAHGIASDLLFWEGLQLVCCCCWCLCCFAF